jgi:pantoate--beta-alanine ligase
MQIFDKIQDFTNYMSKLRQQNLKIGFVPTMGALHSGHISLIEKAKKENDITAVSIFVNPTQFNNADDLKNYPKTPDEDIRMLKNCNTNILLTPSVQEMYSNNFQKEEILKLGSIAEVMEGVHRPGHFNGVVQVVSMLFQLVKPDRAYFGEKDFQQLAIIRYMTEKLKLPVKITGCPTVRESSGLAMSSRNLKLSKDELNEATAISKALFYVRDNRKNHSVDEIKKLAIAMIESSGKLKVEYVEIADEATLQAARDWNQFKSIRCFAAVFCNKVRLIDNVKL